MGRYSRYPAINRDVALAELEEVDDCEAEPEEVVDTTPADEPVATAAPEADEAATEPAEDVEDDGQDWPSPEVLGEMSTSEVLEWVGDDPDRTTYALEVESAGRERKTLLRKLAGA